MGEHVELPAQVADLVLKRAERRGGGGRGDAEEELAGPGVDAPGRWRRGGGVRRRRIAPHQALASSRAKPFWSSAAATPSTRSRWPPGACGPRALVSTKS